jgi:hypothetical protein
MAAHFTRPTRGATRLDDLRWEPAPLAAEAQGFAEADWHYRAYGEKWAELPLLADAGTSREHRHPRLDACPALVAVAAGFPGRTIDMGLARLDPGGWIKEHRDISGGVPMGIGRFHVPMVTHPEVCFFVSGERVTMGPGEVWNLDTTYRHRVVNDSPVSRIHLILDVELNDAVRGMLPAEDWRDRRHQAAFLAIVVGKGLQTAIRDPRKAYRRAANFFRLRILRQSVLNQRDDS